MCFGMILFQINKVLEHWRAEIRPWNSEIKMVMVGPHTYNAWCSCRNRVMRRRFPGGKEKEKTQIRNRWCHSCRGVKRIILNVERIKQLVIVNVYDWVSIMRKNSNIPFFMSSDFWKFILQYWRKFLRLYEIMRHIMVFSYEITTINCYTTISITSWLCAQNVVGFYRLVLQ